MKYFLGIFIFFFVTNIACGGELLDSDFDMVPDVDETTIYMTDPLNRDTDNDGYSDWEELNNGYSPHSKDKKLEDNDFDNDGLSDRMELNFGTKINNKDTDNDGYTDGEEINRGYDPKNQEKIKLIKKLEVDTKSQKLSYFLDGVRYREYVISSGINNSTPKGYFKIINKVDRAWSPYGLWMPYWMGLGNGVNWFGQFGLHELPEWPNGYKEGQDHLGTPVSHGCIRLGVGDAKYLYDNIETGTEVFIK